MIDAADFGSCSLRIPETFTGLRLRSGGKSDRSGANAADYPMHSRDYRSEVLRDKLMNDLVHEARCVYIWPVLGGQPVRSPEQRPDVFEVLPPKDITQACSEGKGDLFWDFWDVRLADTTSQTMEQSLIYG